MCFCQGGGKGPKLPGKHATFGFHRWSLECCLANRSQGVGGAGMKHLATFGKEFGMQCKHGNGLGQPCSHGAAGKIKGPGWNGMF